MLSGAPGGSWGHVRRPVWRRSGRVERGGAGSGDYRRPAASGRLDLGLSCAGGLGRPVGTGLDVPGAAPVSGRWPMPGAAYRPELRRLASICDRSRSGGGIIRGCPGGVASSSLRRPRPSLLRQGGRPPLAWPAVRDREELHAWPLSLLPGADWHEFCHPSPPCVN